MARTLQEKEKLVKGGWERDNKQLNKGVGGGEPLTYWNKLHVSSYSISILIQA